MKTFEKEQRLTEEERPIDTLAEHPAPTPPYQEQPRGYRRYGLPLIITLLLLSSILALGSIGLLITLGVAFGVLAVLLLAAGIILLAVAALYFTLTSTNVETRRFNAGASPLLIVENDIGHIHVSSGETDEVVIQTTRWNRRFWGTPDTPRVRYEQTADGNRFTVQVEHALPRIFFPRRVDFDMTVPRHIDVQLATSIGDIWIKDVHGQVALATSTGSIHARHATLRKNSSIMTKTGSISFKGELDPEGDYTLETRTGSVNMLLENETACHVAASTSTGSIQTNIPEVVVTRRGVTGEEAYADIGSAPSARVTLKSSTGSISLFSKFAGHVPRWDDVYNVTGSSRNRVLSSVIGSIVGFGFLGGLALAFFLAGHFWTILFVTLAFTAMFGSLSSLNAAGIYGGFQGMVFFLGLALLTLIGWWPWLLVVFAVLALLSIGNAFIPGKRASRPEWW